VTIPIISRFGDTWAAAEILPTIDGRIPSGPGAGQRTLLRLPGGRSFDWGRVDPPPRTPAQDVILRGEWIAADAAAMETKAAALHSLIGRRSRLWRSTGTLQQWKNARCVAVSGELTPRERMHYATFELRFDLDAGPWNRETVSTPNYVLTTNPIDISAPNAGNAGVYAVTLTVTAAGSPITQIVVEHWIPVAVRGYTSWTWTGSIPVGQSLVVNAGARSVKLNGVDAYGGMSFHSTLQKIDDWLWLIPGTNTLTLARTGGSAASTASLSYFPGYN
jgi:hypothetical protein